MAFRKYNYVLTEMAEGDIDEILSYIKNELFNPVAASNFANELEIKTEEICKNPGKGRIVENEFLKRDDVRRFIVKNYIAYFIVDEENKEVVILRVVYNKRDQNDILKEL